MKLRWYANNLFPDIILQGFEQIEPFVSIESQLYSEAEFNAIHDYYLEKNWLRQQKGPEGEEAKRQMMGEAK